MTIDYGLSRPKESYCNIWFTRNISNRYRWYKWRLWSIDSYEDKIHEHNIDTMAVIKKYNAPTSSPTGICGSDGRLFYVDLL